MVKLACIVLQSLIFFTGLLFFFSASSWMFVASSWAAMATFSLSEAFSVVKAAAWFWLWASSCLTCVFSARNCSFWRFSESICIT